VTDICFVNGTLASAEGVAQAALTVEDGHIAHMGDAPNGAHAGQVVDLAGDWLVPAFIELHTDNVERCFVPRPGVLWPEGEDVLMAHDRQMASAGVGTVFDALALIEKFPGDFRTVTMARYIDALDRLRGTDMLALDHRIHLRAEVTEPNAPGLIGQWIDHPSVQLMSLTDHTPGQRQFRDLNAFKKYLSRSMSVAEMEESIAKTQAISAEVGAPNRRALVAMAQARRLPLASHDDETAEHVQEALDAGVVIAEFPTRMEAAEAATKAGIGVMIGAPNLVRGGSHSGNVAAIDLARAGCAGIVSSDYAPHGLVAAVGRLVMEAGLSWPDALAMVTATPARLAGLTDRGLLREGLRADLVRLRFDGDHPRVVGLWIAGRVRLQ